MILNALARRLALSSRETLYDGHFLHLSFAVLYCVKNPALFHPVFFISMPPLRILAYNNCYWWQAWAQRQTSTSLSRRATRLGCSSWGRYHNDAIRICCFTTEPWMIHTKTAIESLISTRLTNRDAHHSLLHAVHSLHALHVLHALHAYRNTEKMRNLE